MGGADPCGHVSSGERSPVFIVESTPGQLGLRGEGGGWGGWKESTVAKKMSAKLITQFGSTGLHNCTDYGPQVPDKQPAN